MSEQCHPQEVEVFDSKADLALYKGVQMGMAKDFIIAPKLTRLWTTLPVKLPMGNAVHFNKKTSSRITTHQVALELPELIRYSRKTIPTAQGICRSSCIWV